MNRKRHDGPVKPLDIFTNSIRMKLALVPAGEFSMGSPRSDKMAERDEKPQHKVRITRPYYLGVYPVTQRQYARLMDADPSRFKGDPNRPVEQVTWHDAQEFCERLSALPKEKSAGQLYRLPTEAEWEHACRSGTTTPWFFGDDEKSLGEYAWFRGNSGGRTHPVGQKKPNAWGLFDMLGNVWEWCQDWFDWRYYGKSLPDDPTGPARGSSRAGRGGSWNLSAWGCRSAYRGNLDPGIRYPHLGFRVVRAAADM
jgi:formylglycine-generating enzyme required for sulfatase activity